MVLVKPRRCELCSQSLPTWSRLYCPTCREKFVALYHRTYRRIVDDKREPRQDKIEEMRAKYARIDINEEIDNGMKGVVPDGV